MPSSPSTLSSGSVRRDLQASPRDPHVGAAAHQQAVGALRDEGARRGGGPLALESQMPPPAARRRGSRVRGRSAACARRRTCHVGGARGAEPPDRMVRGPRDAGLAAGPMPAGELLEEATRAWVDHER